MATRKTKPAPKPQDRVRAPIKKIIGELKSWLPNYDHGPNSYPTVLFRLLASLPGGDELEDVGYEPLSDSIGWHEADQLQRVIAAIQDKRDVEDIARALLSDEEEEEDLSERRHHARESESPMVEFDLTSAVGPRVKIWGDVDAGEVEAMCPEGWAVDWETSPAHLDSQRNGERGFAHPLRRLKSRTNSGASRRRR
jgi:hypothetical protein